jgi:vancomycin resistance protein YoaR
VPDNKRPEFEAEWNAPMRPVGGEESASEKTVRIPLTSLGNASEASWPEHEPDGEPGFGSQPTVRNVTPPQNGSPTQHIAQTQHIPQGQDGDPTDEVPRPAAGATSVHGPVMVEPGSDGDTDQGPDQRRRILLIAACVLGVLAVVYGLDLLISSGNVPRGVTVAGVDVGGMSHADAEQKLREQIEPRLAKPIAVRAGDVETKIDPKTAGLTLDWGATLERAGSQPLSPITRVTSFFTSREVGFATSRDEAKLPAALESLRPTTDHDPAEGTIRFEGVKPVAVDPKQGQKLDAPMAADVLVGHWADGTTLELPVGRTPVKTTKEGVQQTLEQVAKPAVSGPVIVKGEGKDATLTPEQLATTLVFEPADGGGLTAKVDNGKVIAAAGPQLKDTEKQGKDAEIVFDSGQPTVKESVDGVGVDWDKSLAPFLEVLKRSDQREIKAEYKHTPAKLTTEQANKLGIKEPIGEFQTGGFAADSGINIKVVAAKVNGAVVKPGGTFSLNGFTGQRSTPQGYVDAGIIENGAPGRAVGGGISQFATTLYNASYYAAMKDAGHQEHSYWITRYPAGREATVFENPDGSSVIDLKFTNDSDTGVAIQTIWTPSSIKVVLWGTKRYIVEGATSERTKFTEPKEIKKNTQPCAPSNGAQGFTVTDTRIFKNLSGAEVKRENRTVHYDPSPKIVCEPPPAG